MPCLVIQRPNRKMQLRILRFKKKRLLYYLYSIIKTAGLLIKRGKQLVNLDIRALCTCYCLLYGLYSIVNTSPPLIHKGKMYLCIHKYLAVRWDLFKFLLSLIQLPLFFICGSQIIPDLMSLLINFQGQAELYNGLFILFFLKIYQPYLV